MNFLITVHTYYPRKDGVQFVTQYLAEGLASRGHSVTVLTSDADLFGEEECINGVSIRRFCIRTKAGIYFGDRLKYRSWVLDNIERFDILINSCTQSATTDWLFPIFAKLNVPKILHLHSIYKIGFSRDDFKTVRDIASKTWLNLRWGYYYAKNAQCFKSYNRVLQLHEHDYANDFFRKKYGIESIVFENAAQNELFEMTAELEKPYALMVANYSDRKNQAAAVDLFAKAELAGWRLVLVGSEENSYYDSLASKVKELKASAPDLDIRLLKKVSREETLELIRGASISLLTSKWEGFPIFIVESMASGVPYISTEVGIVQYLPGGFACGTEADFIAKLRQMASSKNMRYKLGREGRRYACDHFRIESKVLELEELSQCLCEEMRRD